MKRILPIFLGLFLAVVALGISGVMHTAHAPAVPDASQYATVHAVLFWTPGCESCRAVIEEVLPPLEAQYGEQFQLQRVQVVTVDDVNLLLDAAKTYHLKREQVNVPFLVIGEDALVGTKAIADSLPKRIEAGLNSGGVAEPKLPESLAELASREQ